MRMDNLKDVHYDAFISYRHNEFDSFVASNLHKKLENFKLPKSVLPKVKSGKNRIERIFRDVDELPLSDNLSDPISKALANSDFLITICTPRYPQSRWCMKEIEEFLKTHPRDHILVVLAEGEPVDSFPEILCFDEVEARDENGKVFIEKKEIEPLAADTRGQTKKEVLKAIDVAVIKLCAAIFGLNYDDLKQRHREQKIRKMTAIFGSIGAAVLAFAIFATVMFVKISRQNLIISNQYSELQDKYAASMATTSAKLLADGKREEAVKAVHDVMPEGGVGHYNPEALRALYKAMGIYKVSTAYFPECTYKGDAWLDNYGVSSDGKYIFTYDRAVINIYDVDSGELVRRIDDLEGYGTVTFKGSEGVIFSDDESDFFYPIPEGESVELDTPVEDSDEESDEDPFDEETFREQTASLFEIEPGQKIAWAEQVGDSIFCLFDGADYVTKYSCKISPFAKEADTYYEPADFDAEFADEVLLEREEFEVNEALLDQAFYSNDKKYIYALFTNHTARIYDSESGECVTEFDRADEMFSSLRHSDVTGSYILTGDKSYILDGNMDVICVTDSIICDTDDGFILQNEEGTQFDIPWFDLPAIY